jgi:DNA invertase Pin-like site-specific DNA recombinase
MSTQTLPHAGYYIDAERISTEQQEDGNGYDRQHEAIVAYAARLGVSLGVRACDDISGDLERRPELDRLLAPVFAGLPHQVRGVIFEEPGRMARKTWIGMRKLEQLLNAGIDVHFTTYGKVENTPTALFIVTTLMGTQALDKGMLLAKLAAGARGKVLKGTPLNRGIAPLGYSFIGRDDTSAIVINEDEAGTVRRIFAAYLAGDSLQTIAKQLTAERVPTTEDLRPRTGKKGTAVKQKSFGSWGRSSIANILKNPIYKGRVAYYRHAKRLPAHGEVELTADGTRRVVRYQRRTESDSNIVWIDSPELALVSAADWQAAQAAAKNRTSQQAHNVQWPYLVRGHICCACGRARVGKLKLNKSKPEASYAYYRCANQERDMGETRCSEKQVRALDTDAAVWQGIEEEILQPGTLNAAYAKAVGHYAARVDQQAQNRADLDRRIADYEAKQVDLARKLIDKVIPELAYVALNREYEERLAEWRADHEQVVATAERDPSAGHLERLRALLDAIEAGTADKETFVGKRAIVEALGITATVIWRGEKPIVSVATRFDGGSAPVVRLIGRSALSTSQPSSGQRDPIILTFERPILRVAA